MVIQAVEQGQNVLGAASTHAAASQKEADKAANKKETDTVTISDEARQRLEAIQDRQEQERLEEEYQEQAKASDEAADAFADQAKILEIARRIANGDKVPGTDEKKLMEFSSELYQTAKAAAILHAAEEHRKYKSMYEDENKEDIDEKVRELERGQEAESISEPSDGADTENVGTESAVTASTVSDGGTVV